MNNKEQDLQDWMDQHCERCCSTLEVCRTRSGIVVGEHFCWTVERGSRVFCPYNNRSGLRYEQMKREQRRILKEMKPTNKQPDFGDYVEIEQKRYSIDNEHYEYKVISRHKSNTWVDVPVICPATEMIHEEIEDVVYCICNGVDETEVLKFRVGDVNLIG